MDLNRRVDKDNQQVPPFFWCLFTHAHASQARRFSHWLVSCSACACFQLGCYLFWCSIIHARASQAHRSSRWLVSCRARFLLRSSDVTFSGAPSLLYYALPCISIFARYSARQEAHGLTRTRGILASNMRCGLVYSLICCRCFEQQYRSTSRFHDVFDSHCYIVV